MLVETDWISHVFDDGHKGHELVTDEFVDKGARVVEEQQNVFELAQQIESAPAIAHFEWGEQQVA